MNLSCTMTSLFACGLTTVCLCASVASNAAAPANDRFEKAIVLTGRSLAITGQDGRFATADALDPYLGAPNATKPAHSLWYRFDATYAAAEVRLTITDHTASGIRAGVFLLSSPYAGAGGLVSEVQATVSGGNDADVISFHPRIGNRYYVCIDAPGVVDLALQVSGQSNDFFDSAQVLVGDEGTISGSNANCSNEGDLPPNLGLPALVAGVWFRWTPSFSGWVYVDTYFSEIVPGQAHATSVAVFTGTSLNSLTPEGVDFAKDSSSPGLYNNQIGFESQAGVTYTIWVGTRAVRQSIYANSDQRDGSFTLSYYPATSAGEFQLVAPLVVGETQWGVPVDVRHFRAGVGANVTVSTGLPGADFPTATADSDFSSVSSTLSFYPGATGDLVQRIWVPILPDNIPEWTEFFNVRLHSPSSGAVLSGTSNLNIAIKDYEYVEAPSFASPEIHVKEGDGVAYIPLVRRSGLASAMTIYPSAGQGHPSDTAVRGLDYQLQFDEPIYMAPYQSTVSIGIRIANDAIFQGQRSFLLTVSAADAFANTQSAVRVIIDDDEVVIPPRGRIVTALETSEFQDTTFAESTRGGSIDATVTAAGTISGKLTTALGTLSFTGKFDSSGTFRTQIDRSIADPRTLLIQVVSAVRKSYRVVITGGYPASSEIALVEATNFTGASPCPALGNYTFTTLGSYGAAGSVIVSKLGSVSLSGRLFDGTPFVAAGAVDANLYIVAGTSLYGGKGRATLFQPTSVVAPVWSGFHIARPGRANQNVELPAIDQRLYVLMSRYASARSATSLLPSWSAGVGSAALTGVGNANSGTRAMSISPTGKITVYSPEEIKLTVLPSTGIFTGSLIPPGTKKSVPIYGCLIQNSPNVYPAGGKGFGFFLNGIQPGEILLQ